MGNDFYLQDSEEQKKIDIAKDVLWRNVHKYGERTERVIRAILVESEGKGYDHIVAEIMRFLRGERSRITYARYMAREVMEAEPE
jgi:hypothetical protein